MTKPMKIMTSFPVAAFAGLAALVGAADPSIADPLFLARTETFSSHVEVQQFIDSVPVSASVNTGNIAIPAGTASMTGSAVAGQGQLRAGGAGRLNVFTPGLTGYSAGTLGRARFTLDDIIISGPAGTVISSINLAVNGNVSVGADYGGPELILGAVGASSSVQLSGSVSALANTPFSGAVSTSRQVGNCVPDCSVVETFDATGLFAGVTAGPMDLAVTTPDFTVMVGVRFVFNMTLQVSGSASYGISGTAGSGGFSLFGEGVSDFTHTAGFATTGPVFNLPDGYTVNSVSGQIVNNQWAGGGASPAPEPATLASFGLGLAGLGFMRRRRQT